MVHRSVAGFFEFFDEDVFEGLQVVILGIDQNIAVGVVFELGDGRRVLAERTFCKILEILSGYLEGTERSGVSPSEESQRL